MVLNPIGEVLRMLEAPIGERAVAAGGYKTQKAGALSVAPAFVTR